MILHSIEKKSAFSVFYTHDSVKWQKNWYSWHSINEKIAKVGELFLFETKEYVLSKIRARSNQAFLVEIVLLIKVL